MCESQSSRIDVLRAKHRAARAVFSARQQRLNALALAERVGSLPAFQQARRIAAYIAVRGEIELDPVLQLAEANGARVYLPVLGDQGMHFAPWALGEPLHRRRLGLLEPEHDVNEQVPPGGLDLVLVPLVVFDSRCQRIGQGGGFYDRAFSFRKKESPESPVLLGVAHDSQRETALTPMPWDVQLDMIATDKQLYLRENG